MHSYITLLIDAIHNGFWLFAYAAVASFIAVWING